MAVFYFVLFDSNKKKSVLEKDLNQIHPKMDL